MSDTSNQSAKFILDTTLKVLSALVIPLMVWGIRLEITNAIQDERISEMQEDLDKLSNLTTSVQDQALALVRLEGKIDNVDTKIDEVKKLLNK
jgi:peptidoglycan hydrolase CwlO-like protein